MGYEAYTNARDSRLRNMSESLNALDAGFQAQGQRRVGNALAGGDYTGAATEAFQQGDINAGVSIQNAGRARQTADRDQTRTAILAVVTGLRQIPDPARRAQELANIGPRLSVYGVGPEQLSSITPQDLSDQGLDSIIAMYGGQSRQAAPSGYRWNREGTQLEFIPGGPEDPDNQRPLVTAQGVFWPRGSQPPGQPPAGGAPDYVDQLPPGVRPRPNQPSSARPAAGGGERSQPVSVSFPSSRDAQAAITSLVPGVRITSGARDPANNRRVGGAAGSFHLSDRARDLVPPPGMTTAQVAARYRQAGFRALDEGDHVHVSW